MNNLPNRRLVLISGSIAAGKTTAARALATLARSLGATAAAIDMDEMIEAVAGNDWSTITEAARLRACRATASFVQTCFESGAELIAVAGSTLSPYEWDEVTRLLDPAPDTLYVLLRVSLAESIRRAQADSTRVHTRAPAHVEKLAAAIDWSAVRNHDIEIDTDGMTAEDVVGFILTNVASPLHKRRGLGEGS